MTEDNTNDNTNLARRIEELEALLAEQRIETGADETPRRPVTVPILDNVVTPADYAEEPHPPVSKEKIVELAERLEQKFSMELDETVHILKNNLRQSILRELNEQMRENRSTTNNPNEPSRRGFPDN